VSSVHDGYGDRIHEGRQVRGGSLRLNMNLERPPPLTLNWKPGPSYPRDRPVITASRTHGAMSRTNGHVMSAELVALDVDPDAIWHSYRQLNFDSNEIGDVILFELQINGLRHGWFVRTL